MDHPGILSVQAAMKLDFGNSTIQLLGATAGAALLGAAVLTLGPEGNWSQVDDATSAHVAAASGAFQFPKREAVGSSAPSDIGPVRDSLASVGNGSLPGANRASAAYSPAQASVESGAGWMSREAASEWIDTLSYLLSKHPGQALTGTHPISMTVIGQTAYYVKWAADVFDVYTWDDEYVYLKEVHSGGHPYSLDPGKLMKRSMRIGDSVDAAGTMSIDFDGRCRATGAQLYPYRMTLEGRYPFYDVGGALADQDVIVLKYDYFHGNYERLFFSKEWGLVRWELYVGGALKHASVFNTPAGPATPPDTAAACGGQGRGISDVDALIRNSLKLTPQGWSIGGSAKSR